MARSGEGRTALAVWRGSSLAEALTRQGLDTMETVAWIASEANRRRAARVRVDEIGIGTGVVDWLLQLGVQGVEAVNVARGVAAGPLRQQAGGGLLAPARGAGEGSCGAPEGRRAAR
ncbi:MAG: hypothetical protein HY704_10815 [Gemmatimonadetes bacterium]|nr:hypothetical protein [Gemmatimonadota bacterium]